MLIREIKIFWLKGSRLRRHNFKEREDFEGEKFWDRKIGTKSKIETDPHLECYFNVAITFNHCHFKAGPLLTFPPFFSYTEFRTHRFEVKVLTKKKCTSIQRNIVEQFKDAICSGFVKILTPRVLRLEDEKFLRFKTKIFISTH